MLTTLLASAIAVASMVSKTTEENVKTPVYEPVQSQQVILKNHKDLPPSKSTTLFLDKLLGSNPDESGTKQAKSGGKFQVYYNPAKNHAYKTIENIFAKAHMYERVAAVLNKNINLPRNIAIVSTECGQANAYYDPKHHAIVMCYELVGEFAKSAAPYAATNTDLYRATIGSTLFTFFHELGHTLIHELNLPAVGREEDAADQLGVTFITAGGNDLGEIALVAVARQFKERAMQTRPEDLPYWDEHPLDQQRYFNLICLLYGSNPRKYTSLPSLAGLPGGRARQCPSEYQQATNSWLRLIQLSQKS